MSSPKKDKSYPDRMILIGPYRLEKLVSKKGQIVYIFYDYHQNPKSCPEGSVEMTDFIDQLLKEKRDYIIDFLLEASPKYEPSKGKVPLEDIEYMLRKCFIPDRRECKYENTRVHWVDVRVRGLLLQEYLDIFFMITMYENLTPEQFKEKNLDGDLVKKYLIRKLRNVVKKFGVDKVLIESKVMKQIVNIEDSHIREKFFREIRNKIVLAYDKFVKLLYRRRLTHPDAKLRNALIVFISLFMDAYTVGRMLKSYDGEQMKNIIIYTGGGHSDSTSEMLQKLDFNLVDSVGIERKDLLTSRVVGKFQCLDITPLLPLFG